MPKGHSTLQIELDALKLTCKAYNSLLDEMLVRITNLETRGSNEGFLGLAGIVANNDQEVLILKKQVEAMNEAFSRGNIPQPQYESKFRVWPGANPSSNGS
jgi:hypothetical protein